MFPNNHLNWLAPLVIFTGTACIVSLLRTAAIDSETKNQYHHPPIKSFRDVYQIPLSDSIIDVCYDIRSKQVIVIDGQFIQSQCELDSNRWHFNIKHK